MSHSCPPLFSLQEMPVLSSNLQDDKWVWKHHLKLAEFSLVAGQQQLQKLLWNREEKQHSTEPLGFISVLLFFLLVHQEGLFGSCYHMYPVCIWILHVCREPDSMQDANKWEFHSSGTTERLSSFRENWAWDSVIDRSAWKGVLDPRGSLWWIPGARSQDGVALRPLDKMTGSKKHPKHPFSTAQNFRSFINRVKIWTWWARMETGLPCHGLAKEDPSPHPPQENRSQDTQFTFQSHQAAHFHIRNENCGRGL